MGLLSSISAYIREHDLLSPRQRVVLGVSGGADSICLLDILCKLEYEPIVAHMDHQLRPGSAEDAAYVGQIAEERGLEFRIARGNPADLAKEGHSLEEASRMVRYRHLIRVAIDSGVNTVAVGHTKDDQAETVLMHLLRGAGPAGLKGMKPKSSMDFWIESTQGNEISLIRPMLEACREDVRKYCLQMGLRPREDPSNLDNSFQRNRIRNELMPILEEYNPEIRKALVRTSRIMARVYELSLSLVEEAKRTLIIETGDEYVLFDLNKFEQLHISLKWELLYQLILDLSIGDSNVDYEAVSRAMSVFSLGEERRSDLVGGTEAFRFHGLGLIRHMGTRIAFKQFPQLRGSEPIQIMIGEEVTLNDHWKLRTSCIQSSGIDLDHLKDSVDPYVAYFDTDQLSQLLVIRAYSTGDRFQPFGMEGSVKVSDHFTNEKIPHLARQYWPILDNGKDILWVMGLRPSNLHRIHDQTTNIAEFRIVPLRD